MFKIPPAPTPVPKTLPTNVKAVGIGYLKIIPLIIKIEEVIKIIDASEELKVIPVTNLLFIVLATDPPCITAPKKADIPTIKDPLRTPITPAEFIGPKEGEALLAPITHEVINAPKKANIIKRKSNAPNFLFHLEFPYTTLHHLCLLSLYILYFLYFLGYYFSHLN